MTSTLTPTQHLARWRELGITDMPTIFRLLDVGIDVTTYGEYFDAGITDLHEVYQLKASKISPKLISQYQAEAAVSVDDVRLLSAKKITPSMLKELLAQFPGCSVAQAVAMKKGGLSKSMLALLVKLDIPDPDRMSAMAKKFAATELKEWMARGATAEDFFDTDGNVQVPKSADILIRTIGRPEVEPLLRRGSMKIDEARRSIAFFDAVRPSLSSDEEAVEVTKGWQSDYRPIEPEQALVLHRHGFNRNQAPDIIRFAETLARPLDEICRALQTSPGLTMAVTAHRSYETMVDPTEGRHTSKVFDLVPKLRQDLEGTARWMADLATITPLKSGSMSTESRLYAGLSQIEGIQWQLDLIATIPEGAKAGLVSSWESHYYHSVLRKTNHPDVEAMRQQMATRIVAGVEPDEYEILAGLGVAPAEMLDIVRRADTVSFAPKPKVVDDDDEPTTDRPAFDGDD